MFRKWTVSIICGFSGRHPLLLSIISIARRGMRFLVESFAMTRKSHKAEGRGEPSEERLEDEWIFWSEQKGDESYEMEIKKTR